MSIDQKQEAQRARPFMWHVERFERNGQSVLGETIREPMLPDILANLRRNYTVIVTELHKADQFDDLLDVVRTLCAVAERMSQPNSENYPSPLAEGSPLLAAARRACVLRGFTEAGLSVDIAGGAA